MENKTIFFSTYGSWVFGLLIFVTVALNSSAQTATITGNAKTYAGDTLHAYMIEDFITKQETEVSAASVDADGNFTFKIKVSQTSVVYIDLTVFKGIIFVQPGKIYEVVLPQKQKIRPDDELNPFFKPMVFYVKCVNNADDDLNSLIPQFDREYSRALSIILNSTSGFSKKMTDSIENIINGKFNTENSFFSDYKNYRFAMLDYTAYRRKKDDIVTNFFSNKPILTQNPAYADLFDEMLANPFSGGPNSVLAVKGIYSGIYDRSYDKLKRTVTKDSKFKDQRLADYVILKGLHDSYFSDSFPKEAIIAVIDSFAMMSPNRDFRNIADRMVCSLTKLMIGYPVPQFSLEDVDGNKYSPAGERGKFIYLTFFNPRSYTALGDFDLIKSIRKEIPPETLQIITIFVSPNRKDLENFMRQNPDCNWPVVWYNGDKTLLKDYNIRAYPTYYMINPAGNLVMNPAPSPTENFGQRLDALVRNWKIEQYRTRTSEGLR